MEKDFFNLIFSKLFKNNKNVYGWRKQTNGVFRLSASPSWTNNTSYVMNLGGGGDFMSHRCTNLCISF